jgi:agmatine deiminase
MSDESVSRYLPPEWAVQSGVMLTWPHPHSDWALDLASVEAVFVALAREVSLREQVLIACYDPAHTAQVRDRLRNENVNPERVKLHIAPSNDTWARDHGPITAMINGHPQLLDFSFNGWGDKYAHALDDRVTARLHAAGAFGAARRQTVDLVLEGGSIDVDGAGTLLTTASCLLSGARNPGIQRAHLEARLHALLGIERVLWLEHGRIPGDDTDGHIDTLARFCNSHTIAYVCAPSTDKQAYPELAAMEQELACLRMPAGDPYRLVPLPLPQPIYDERGQRLPATYANFLIINDAVLVPVYGDPADEQAMQRLQPCFPGRSLIEIDARALIRQYGSLHCVAMQLPAGVLLA